MKLKDELKTKGFQNEYQEAYLNVLFTASWLKSTAQRRFKPYDLSHEQYNVLRILRGSHPQCMQVKDITGRMVDRSSNTTRIIDKLVAKGWAIRKINPDNRREMQVSLTREGLDLLEVLDQEMENMPKMALTPEEARTLSLLLDKVRDSEY